MEKKDKRFVAVVIAVIAITIIVAGCVVALNLKQPSITPKEDQNTKETTNVVTHSEEEVKNAALEVLSKLANGYDALYGYKGNINSLPDSKKVLLAFWLLKDDNTSKSISDYTKDEILGKMKGLFGNSFTMNFEDFEGYKFNTTTNKYEAVPEQAHGIDVNLGNLAKSTFISYQEENGKYVITYKQAFEKNVDENVIITNIEGKELTSYSINDNRNLLENLDTNNQDFLSVTYTFEYENDVLVLKSLTY